MLQLINQERRNAGVPELTLGNNPAAQYHADSCLTTGTGSHWGSNGLKPYMRYSRAGGYQKNAENWFYWEYEGLTGTDDIPREITKAMTSLMNSPSHRQTILDKWYRKVNIGLSWTSRSFVAIQHFEGDLVEYQRLPSLAKGRLSFVGTIRNSIKLSSDDALSVDVWFDPMPKQLALGQLIRTNAYDAGTIVASIRRPLPVGYLWPNDRGSSDVRNLARPEDFAPNSPVPTSIVERSAILSDAYENNKVVFSSLVTYPLITANYWRLGQESFFVSADVRTVLDAHGPGVYSILLWAPFAGTDEKVNISHYSVFHKGIPP